MVQESNLAEIILEKKRVPQAQRETIDWSQDSEQVAITERRG